MRPTATGRVVAPGGRLATRALPWAPAVPSLPQAALTRQHSGGWARQQGWTGLDPTAGLTLRTIR